MALPPWWKIRDASLCWLAFVFAVPMTLLCLWVVVSLLLGL